MASTTNNPRFREQEKTAGAPLEKAKDIGTQAMDKAKQAAGNVGDMASQAASNVTKTAQKWGESLSENFGQASHAVSETVREGVREGAHYLEEAHLGDMADEVTRMIRRNPMPAVFIGLAVGFVLGRAMRS